MATGIKSTKNYFKIYDDSTDETTFQKAYLKPLTLIISGGTNVAIFDVSGAVTSNIELSTENMDNDNSTFSNVLEIVDYLEQNQ